MKRFAILLLSLILIASLITGCKTTTKTETKATPTVVPTQQVTPEPTPEKTPEPTQAPTPAPTTAAPTTTPPTAAPTTVPPTPASTQSPTAEPTTAPSVTDEPTATPVSEPTMTPTATTEPTAEPTETPEPTEEPVTEDQILVMTNGNPMSELGVGGFITAAGDFGYSPVTVTPSPMNDDGILSSINSAASDDIDLMVMPGWDFRNAVESAQDQHHDITFVLIDNMEVFNDNVITFQFAEEQAGFLAGYAAAIELNDAVFGFIGGMEIEAVQQFNWGFQQGLLAANTLEGTNASITPENVIYTGSFGDEDLGAATAAQLYDSGVDCIFAAAGFVGNGVIEEAKARAATGSTIWVVGVDYDQYEMGIYNGSNSVVLTSAIKRYDGAAYYAVEEYHNETLDGGVCILLTINEDAVGIPSENPNLSSNTISKVNSIISAYKHGTVTINPGPGELIP